MTGQGRRTTIKTSGDGSGRWRGKSTNGGLHHLLRRTRWPCAHLAWLPEHARPHRTQAVRALLQQHAWKPAWLANGSTDSRRSSGRDSGGSATGDPRARSTPAASNAFGMSGLSQWVDRHRPHCRCRNGAAELAHAAGSWRAKATSRAACWSGKATTRYSLLCRSPDGGDGVVNVPAPDS